VLDGDDPEITGLVMESQGENPDVYWATDQFLGFDGTADIALGMATWRMDTPHVDTY